MKKVSFLLGLFALAMIAGPLMADCGCPQQVQQVVAAPQVQYVVQPQVQRVIVQQQAVQQVVVQRQAVVAPQVNVNVNRGVLGLRQRVNVQVR